MTERFKYNKCPLVEVTYQVNYPTILAIDANEPVDFQKLIMEKYPNYDLKTEFQGEVKVNMENDDMDASASMSRQQKRKIHIFVSEDQKWRIALAKNMLAFTTVDYKYWEDMVLKSKDVIKAFVDSYKPLYFTRVGLRYIDAFDRVELKLEDTPWDKLLKPHVCGCLGYRTDEEVKVKSSIVNSEIMVNDVFIKLAAGSGMIDRHDGNLPHEAFILNCDYYYNKKISIDNLFQTAEKLHNQSHSFFRESITNELHYAMKPEELKL